MKKLLNSDGFKINPYHYEQGLLIWRSKSPCEWQSCGLFSCHEQGFCEVVKSWIFAKVWLNKELLNEIFK